MRIVLDHFNHSAVHKFNCNRQNARFDDVGHTGTCDLIAIKAHKHRSRAFWFVQDAQSRFCYDAKLTFRAANDAKQIKPATVQMRAADLDDFTIHHHHRDAHEIVRCDAILKAMRAAGIHRYVACNCTGELAGGVGRIEKAILFNSARHAKVRAPCLNANDAVVVVCFQYIIHPRDA